MKTVENTLFGQFEVFWGVLDPHIEIQARVGSFSHYKSGSEAVTFQDPLYPNEAKTLSVYRHASNPKCIVLLAEITPSIWAYGFQLDGQYA
ncbi:hypothetical protein G6L63_00925 [Agrobacterium vitis]|uniref:hypothetical protein n=1 Tax=Agrobacterium vitis TaxID=373 RepID=UPI0011C06810|nr:hypothetical protein [Agrobacterium vitis]MCF1477890.1 hypothetical protein [Agrobacterium vitis]MUZ98133.1 hypothetical protein [Agrobacterium vitis]MVA30965.1 hypothetical protein [Agrobacterium vitis]NOJ35746.1 hypothetical protein [Agrobacterium vitis]NSZ46485.1 hypothetical protein [Agrobacterium vitis]